MLHIQRSCCLQVEVEDIGQAAGNCVVLLSTHIYSDSRLPSFLFTGFGKTSFSLSDLCDIPWGKLLFNCYCRLSCYICPGKKGEQPTCTAFSHCRATIVPLRPTLLPVIHFPNTAICFASGILVITHCCCPDTDLRLPCRPYHTLLHATACLDKNMAKPTNGVSLSQ